MLYANPEDCLQKNKPSIRSRCEIMCKEGTLDELRLKAFGIDIAVRSPHNDFLEFVNKNYRAFPGTDAGVSRIQVFFSDLHGEYARSLKDKDATIYWENEFGFTCRVTISDRGIWQVRGYHFNLLKTQTIEARYRNYQRSMRWMIHFPLFIMLEREQNKGLLHASAVSKNGKALIFFGPNKAGKSGLCLSLAAKHGYQVMTDNFLLYDFRAVYGFPERSRVSPEMLSHINLPWPHSNYTVYKKYHMDIDEKQFALESMPNAFFFVRFGDQLSLSPASRDNFTVRIQETHDDLAEFPAYSFYGSPLRLRRQANSLTVFDNVPVYDLIHPKTWALDATVNEVLDRVD